MTQISCLDSKVFVGSIVESSLNDILNNIHGDSKKVILVDSNTNENCLPSLFTHFDGLETAEIIEIPAGEENKTLEICFSVWEALSEMAFGRNDLLICLGGGMVCDMGGFISSIFKRGLNCIYIPTSLLAMVDASIGGKTGIDLGSLKNQLGTFSTPSDVVIDTDFLQTLPENEMTNGLAEMLKHGLIADESHFQKLKYLNVKEIEKVVISDSLKIKAEIVESDPKEQGRRKLLNFGHTVGHAIEGYFLGSENQLDHGLAIAHGMLVEAKISVQECGLSATDFIEIETVLRERFDFRVFTTEECEAFIVLMLQDKKRVNGSRFTLLEGIGKSVYDIEVSDTVVRSALKVLC